MVRGFIVRRCNLVVADTLSLKLIKESVVGLKKWGVVQMCWGYRGG